MAGMSERRCNKDVKTYLCSTIEDKQPRSCLLTFRSTCQYQFQVRISVENNNIRCISKERS
ncbi:hypothetical protein E2C01_022272 [Portunus trituberculatus]|uniref:Uncharacterized protein n=1 Tax=Portunus trituberculatus TaxID=210409 RepID=A0A5B7E6U3_PORTR|nr:hypothetical protein [Portunus trituberculatus]